MSTYPSIGKPQVKYMYVHKHNKKHGTISISMLDNSGHYSDWTLDFRSSALTYSVGARIRELFAACAICAQSDIMTSPDLDEKHPFVQCLLLLHQHIPFKFSRVPMKRAFGRVARFYTQKKVKRPSLNLAWKLALSKGKCPWITQRFELFAQTKGNVVANRMRLMRLMMLYMDIKNYLYAAFVKSNQKRQRLAKLQQQDSCE